MTLSAVARATAGRLIGDDVTFVGAGTDSRTVSAGALFVALRGERCDGHDYVAAAQARGAIAALVERDAATALASVIVTNTRVALGDLASAWRAQHSAIVVGVTGSNGKTTTKELIAAVLSTGDGVLATQGNFNNDIGVPLTLFGLSAHHRYAVIEMGANHPGELSRLAQIAWPNVAVITGAAPAHLEGFGSLEGVAMGEGAEIFAGFASGGRAVVNGDDAFADYWLRLARPHATLTFGLEPHCDVAMLQRRARTPLAAGSIVTARTPAGRIEFELSLAGRHNVRNALAAVAVGVALDVPLADIARALEGVRAPHGRLELRSGRRGCTIIDDTYNANPGSLDAGLEALAEMPGRHWLALGDMGELGADAAALHRDAGERARGHGVERLYALGPLTRFAVEAFGAGAAHFDDAAALAAALDRAVEADVRLLVKGSRSMHMERLVAALAPAEPERC